MKKVDYEGIFLKIIGICLVSGTIYLIIGVIAAYYYPTFAKEYLHVVDTGHYEYHAPKYIK